MREAILNDPKTVFKPYLTHKNGHVRVLQKGPLPISTIVELVYVQDKLHIGEHSSISQDWGAFMSQPY